VKIAYVITRADAVGGATIHVRDLARAMRELGHDPLVLVGGRGHVTDQFEAAGVRIQSLRYLRRAIHPVRDLLALNELTAALRDFAPDLVSTHTAKAGWIGRAAAARLGLPAIYTPHGLPVAGRFSSASGLLFTLAERAASRWSAAIVCVCESERRLALDKRIAPPDRLIVIHNGVRDVPPEFRACPDREPLRICTVARFEHPKDFATLITALSLVEDRHWRLDIAGDGPLEPEIRHLAAARGIAGQVHFLGYQSDPAPLLASSQLFVLASRSEAFPRSILEAMRAGLPVVATDVGGVKEAVRHRATGLLVPPQDPAALAAAIAELRIAPHLRRELGDRARRDFERSFRLEHTVGKLLTLYATVLDKT
jgi:glycosyltransferase involved in cell wall biosynthesis